MATIRLFAAYTFVDGTVVVVYERSTDGTLSPVPNGNVSAPHTEFPLTIEPGTQPCFVAFAYNTDGTPSTRSTEPACYSPDGGTSP